ncbi:MAG TPA: hypothetical protein DIC56_10375 [Rhizobium sp.]|nr:hypothetical protein [Rhizobium sp.]
MAFSTESNRDNKIVKASRPVIGASRKALMGAVLVGGVIAVAIWTTAVIATVQTATVSISADPGMRNAAAGRRDVALRDDAAMRNGFGKAARRSASAADIEEAKLRIAAAVARTEDPLLAVLPEAMSLASVDKADRLAWSRADVSPDENALAVLRRALKKAEGERAAMIALAAELEKQQAAAKPQMVASIEPPDASVDRLSTGAIPSSSMSGSFALAYAAPSSARETVESTLAEDAFGEVLAGSEEIDSGLPEDGPLPSKRPKIPEKQQFAKRPEKENEKPAATEQAYAKPGNSIVEEDDKRPSLFGRKAQLPGRGSRIAVYDISAGMVYMPNGEKLEAHSGRGNMRDNPRHVSVKNRGPTPPNVYSLRMRESRFHGVEAIRMTPVGGAKMYGRDGFLTHTYLLRQRGDSSGCVVFEDYNRFLKAFKRGEVAKLIVVPRMAELPKYMAAL